MGRPSVSLKVLAAEVGRVQERLYRTSDEAQTRQVRKVVPWEELEQRAAERKAASAAPPPWKLSQARDEIEKAPDSGVRGLENHALSYSVYSVADFESRPRTSAPPPLTVVVPSRWPDVGRSAKAVVRAWWSYYVRATPRPQVMDVCRVPLMTLRTDLVAALSQLPWRRIGIRTGIAFAAVLALFFVVMTVAELTDDLKPSRTSANELKKIDVPKPEAPNAAPTPAPEPAAIEIDDVAPAAASPGKKAPVAAKAKPPVKKKTAPASPGKKGPDLFNP